MKQHNDFDALKSLAHQLGRNFKSVYALSAGNDPYLAEMPARAGRAKWFANIYQSLGIEAGVHLRRIHYRLISQAEPIAMADGEPYQNTHNCWQMLINAARDARYLGLIPPLQFDDRRNPEPDIFFHPQANTAAQIQCRGGGLIVGNFCASYECGTIDLPDLRLIAPTLHQPHYHLEIWCEQSTMNDVLMPLARRYGANLVTGGGRSFSDCMRTTHQAN
jgi:hypothetical protein